MPRLPVIFSFTAALLVAATHCAPQAAPATPEYPRKPLRVIVGFPPGGPVDLQARIVMQKLSGAIHQPVVIDNRAGADGVLASEMVAKSAADGYPLLYGSAGHVINHVVRGKSLPYDTIRDFPPVGILTGSPYLLVAHAAHIQAELARWTPVIKASGMRID